MAKFNLLRLGIVARVSALVRRFHWYKLSPGAPIIYRVTETSTSPTLDALAIYPTERGEFYSYVRHKYWRIEAVWPDGTIVAHNALMERYLVRPNDPNLRKARLLDRLRYGSRFPYPA